MSAPVPTAPPLPIWKCPAAIALFLVTAMTGLGADLLLKHWAGERLSTHAADAPPPVIHLIPGWIDLEWTYNHGAAMGSFQGYRGMFLIVSTCAVLFLGYLFLTADPKQRAYPFILGMLLAGVLGNMYDRVVLGAVRDMIHALPGRHWPDSMARYLPGFWGNSTELFPWIFNIADSLLCVGVAAMLIYSLFFTPSVHKNAVNPA